MEIESHKLHFLLMHIFPLQNKPLTILFFIFFLLQINQYHNLRAIS